ncbi:hypothetical protein [Flagellimonas myxillae]|uniref:hypothetical protein n=1 Tax=Flagellimonas myxillae TaxID=2942214 RepID=UPI00201F9F35|nr:hypothetical protein [Muricauda myxillae]MCL6265890.1 hypothetical protein [Muricauda myxillae]
MDSLTKNSKDSLQELLVRFERNNKMVQRLSKKINSYTCEPNNLSCFEKLYELRQSFKAYANQQNKIMQLLKQKKVEAKNLKADIKRHLEYFKKLEQEIAAYLLATDQYSQEFRQ